MARQLGALTVLLEDLGWIPGTSQKLTTVCNSSSRGSDALLASEGTRDTYGAHMRTYRQTSIQLK